MAHRWLALLPHVLMMLMIYAVVVGTIALAVGVQDFWLSLAVAFAVTLAYPPVARRLGIAPAIWQRG